MRFTSKDIKNIVAVESHEPLLQDNISSSLVLPNKKQLFFFVSQLKLEQESMKSPGI